MARRAPAFIWAPRPRGEVMTCVPARRHPLYQPCSYASKATREVRLANEGPCVARALVDAAGERVRRWWRCPTSAPAWRAWLMVASVLPPSTTMTSGDDPGGAPSCTLRMRSTPGSTGSALRGSRARVLR